MKRLFFSSILLSIFAFSEMKILSYEELAKWHTTDHVVPFKHLFTFYKPKNLLELGLGFGTINFIRHCDRVLSVELFAPYSKMRWFNESNALYKEYPNWQASLIDLRKDTVLEAAQRCAEKNRDPWILRNYGKALESLRSTILSLGEERFGEEVECLFIDSGFTPRGDLVNVFFGYVPVIVAHDTNTWNGFFKHRNYHKVSVPSDYERIHFADGKGTTFYIHRSRAELIEHMRSF